MSENLKKEPRRPKKEGRMRRFFSRGIRTPFRRRGKSPTLVHEVESSQFLKESTNDEHEVSYRLTSEQAEHAQKNVLEKQGATITEVKDIDSTWYELGPICKGIKNKELKGLCTVLEPRVRIKIEPETGETEWEWTVKIPNGDEEPRTESEGIEATMEEALEKMEEALMEYLDLDNIPELKPSWSVKKHRVTYEYPKRDDGEHTPCTGSKIEFDTWTHLQGVKLKNPIITVDVESKSMEDANNCRNCLERHSPKPNGSDTDAEQLETINRWAWNEWVLQDLLDEKGLKMGKIKKTRKKRTEEKSA